MTPARPVLRVLVVGDLVGSPGRRAFARVVTRLRAENAVDAVVANAENAAGGRGLTPDLAEELFSAGADALTLGDHAWDQKTLVAGIGRDPRVLRPANFAPGCPGRGWVTLTIGRGTLTVINLVGRVFMAPADCPFRTADALLAGLPKKHPILVDIHAEATSEKIALGRYLDGRVSAVLGSHTHVPTADERILPGGTACQTDLGMTGPADSVLGRDAEAVLKRFLTGMPVPFGVAKQDAVLQGALLEIDALNGRALAIRRYEEKLED